MLSCEETLPGSVKHNNFKSLVTRDAVNLVTYITTIFAVNDSVE